MLPPSVRAIHRLRDFVHRRWRALALVALALAALVAAARGIYTVENGEAAAVLRFGRLVDDAVGPGIHLGIGGVDRVVKARTGEVFRLEIAGDFAPELAMVTGDENLIETTLVVQYRISDLGHFLFATESPEILIAQAVRTALVKAFAATPVDEVLTSAKASIQNAVREAAQQRLNRYDSGVTLVAVSLQSVNPPREASGAFRAVSDAKAEAAQAVNQAEGEKDRALRLARGESGQIRAQAGADADARLQQARGASNRFRSLLVQSRQSPEQTRVELYHATVQKALAAARLVILAPGDKPRIDIHYIDRQGTRPGIPPGVSFDDR